MENMGYAIAMAGLALCAILCGIGSAIGLYKTASAAAGVTGENPKKFGKIMFLVFLPSTQGLYGFLVALILNSHIAAVTTLVQGWAMFGALMPMAIAGLVTGIFQGKAATNCIYAVSKQDSLSGKLLLFPATIELYAIFGLIVSMIVGISVA